MTQLFQVVFTGRLRSGFNPEQAARDFAAVFKVSEEKAWKLVLRDQEHVLKRDIDEPNATRYRDILEEIGLDVRVEPAGTPIADAEGGEPVIAPEPVQPSAAGYSAEGGAAPQSSGIGRDENPYAPPAADLTPPPAAGDGDRMTGPHKVPAGHGWQWIKDAWAQYAAQPWSWIGAVLLIYLINLALSFVPVIGGLASIVLGPIFIGGLMLGARAQEHTGQFRAGAVFDGFSRNGGQLALVGVLYFVALLGAFLIAGLLLMAGGLLSAGTMEALSSNDPEAVAAVMGPGLLLLLLIVLLLIVPVLMAYWFAPALVAIDGLPAIQAMGASFRACLTNIVPFLVYGLAWLLVMVGVGLVLGIAGAALAALAGPLGLVVALIAIPLMIVLGTVVVVSIYTGYRDVFYGMGAAGATWAAR